MKKIRYFLFSVALVGLMILPLHVLADQGSQMQENQKAPSADDGKCCGTEGDGRGDYRYTGERTCGIEELHIDENRRWSGNNH